MRRPRPGGKFAAMPAGNLKDVQLPLLQGLSDQPGLAAGQTAVGIDDVEHGAYQNLLQCGMLNFGQQVFDRVGIKLQLAVLRSEERRVGKECRL